MNDFDSDKSTTNREFTIWLNENRELIAGPITEAERLGVLELRRSLGWISSRSSPPISIRRLAYAAGVLLVVGGAAMLIWSPWRKSGGGPKDKPVPPLVAQRPLSPPAVVKFEIRHFRSNTDQYLGTIGKFPESSIHLQDSVKVSIRLSAPGYCYLIVLKPNGSFDPCPKNSGEVPPGWTTTIEYPENEMDAYGLTDGVGAQAFVLITSASPLPSFDSWDRKAGIPWRAAPARRPLRFDGLAYVQQANPTLGPPAQVHVSAEEAPASPFVAVCEYLKQLPGLGIEGVSFGVLPRDQDAVEPTSHSEESPEAIWGHTRASAGVIGRQARVLQQMDYDRSNSMDSFDR